MILEELERGEWEDPDAEKFRSWKRYELSNEAIINGFFERSLWLTDYDEERNDWKPRFDIYDTDEISRKMKSLNNEVLKIQSEYG